MMVARRQARRVGVIGFSLHVDGLPFMGTEPYMQHFGSNVGNLAFSYAVHSQISQPKSLVSELRVPAEKFRDHVDALVFPAANNINPKEDLGWLANLIERTGLPLVIIGLGVQASTETDRFEVPPGTRRFFDVVRERNIRLGLRGDHTQQFLREHGVENTVVTGCPSNFLNPDADLGSVIARQFDTLPEHPSIALNLEYFRLEANKTAMLTGWLREHGGFMVFQSDSNVIGLHRHDQVFDLQDEGYRKKLGYYSKYFLGSSEPTDFVRFAAQYGRTFIHLPSWMDSLRAVDLSIGTRFHGNMLAMQVGRPAVVFVHDTRTRELCVSCGVPFISWKEVEAGATISDVLKRVTFDAAIYNKVRIEKARICRGLYESVGIEVSEQLRTLSN